MGAFARHHKHTHSSQDLRAGLAWSDWGSPTGKLDWGIQGDDLSKLRKLASFGIRSSDELDLSWVQILVKEGSPDIEATTTC